MTLRQRRSDDGDNGDSGVLKTRVSRQKQGSKEKEEERPLNRFYSKKNVAHQARLNTAWERNDSFLTTTDTAEMMDNTLLHNGTVQRADFRLIHPAPWQIYHITTKRTHQPWSDKGLPPKECNNLVLIERTRESHKTTGTSANKEWRLRRQDSFHYKWFQKREDYTSYKTQQTRYYDKQGSKKELGHS